MPRLAKAESNVIEFDADAIRAREREVAAESDQAILARLQSRFLSLEEMTGAVAKGHMRSMIVTGPAGFGKTHGIARVLELAANKDIPVRDRINYEIIKGSMSAVGLYAKLHEYKGERNVIVFDDTSRFFSDEESLELLKGALDTSHTRTISWNKDSRLLRTEGIDNRFEFKGSVIFITNIKFNMVSSKKLRAHLDALESRSHYVDLEMDTVREKLVWINHVVRDLGMLDHYEFDNGEQDEILQFVEDNQNRLRDLSLRSVVKISDLRKAFPHKWEEQAENTLMRKGVLA